MCDHAPMEPGIIPALADASHCEYKFICMFTCVYFMLSLSLTLSPTRTSRERERGGGLGARVRKRKRERGSERERVRGGGRGTAGYCVTDCLLAQAFYGGRLTVGLLPTF